MNDLHDFLERVSLNELSNENGYNDGQFARYLNINDSEFPDIAISDIVIVGVAEFRGNEIKSGKGHGPNAIRRQFYQLYNIPLLS